MIENRETGALEAFNFDQLLENVPELKRFNYRISSYQFNPPIDSSDMEPTLWAKLVKIISYNYENFDGFVILHGTDTMAYTASALSFMLENLAKPVVFTGSQIPIGVLRTDGRENLITAIEIAGARIDGRPVVPEVSLLFQNRLYRGNRTHKCSAGELDAFRSYNYPLLAEVGVKIAYNFGAIAPAPPVVEPLRVARMAADGVAIVKLFPGISEQMLRAMLSAEGLQGVVLETYGAGNAPTNDWFLQLMRQTVERGVTVLNVTQCDSGSVEMQLYETGQQLRAAGVISGYDITTEAAITKLMYVMGKNLTPNYRHELMARPVKGEFTL